MSRYGVIPLSGSLDHVGPIARTAKDVALLLEVIAGMDPKDPMTSALPVPRYRDKMTIDNGKLRVGVLTQLIDDCLSREVRKAVDAAIQIIEDMGTNVSGVSVPHIRTAASVTNLLMACEATANHEKWLGSNAEEYQPSVRTRLETGYFYTAMHYLKAMRAREWFRKELGRIFKDIDIILSPTCPIPAFRIGQETIDVDGSEVDPRSALANFTRLYNLTGLPAVSIPCGFTGEGMPIGLQLACPTFAEESLFQLAYAYEQCQPWKDRRPEI